MSHGLVPENETERLAALYSYKLLDTLYEDVYDDLVRLASVICGTPIALISLIDEKRQWFKANLGLPDSETPRDMAFCAHTLSRDDIMVVEDTAKDIRFHDNPLVTGGPKIKFYAGAPLKSADGLNLGTLCVIDIKPRQLTAVQKETLSILARQVEANFELRRNTFILKSYEEKIQLQYDQLKALEKNRQELISLVVHDLKTPLAAILLTNEMLIESNDQKKIRSYSENIKSASEAMLRLVMNVLDLNTSEEESITPRGVNFNLKNLVTEIDNQATGRLVKLGQKISIQVNTDDFEMHSDMDLIKRVFENLVDNALKYASAKGQVIFIEISKSTDQFMDIKVKDQGVAIKPEDREKIFQKYTRLDAHADVKRAYSRGLGLVFCRLAIEALDGRIWVEGNEPTGTVFCIQIPKIFTKKRSHLKTA